MLPPGMGYDRAVTVFSPDGRLYQVDYALVLVNNSPTAFGISSDKGVALAGIEKKSDALQDRRFSHKIFPIDEHVAATVAGFSSDARILVDQARRLAQANRYFYDEPIDIDYLAKTLGDLIQSYTQTTAVRPFGVSLIIGGIDLIGPAVYQLDPAGVYNKYFITAAGVNRTEAIEAAKKFYNKDIDVEKLKEIAVISMIASNKTEASPETIRLAYGSIETKKVVMAEESEISEIFERVKGKI